MLQRIILLLCCFSLLAGCGGSAPEATQATPEPTPAAAAGPTATAEPECPAQRYLNQSVPLVEAATTAASVVTTTDRLELEPQIKRLQDLRAQLDALSVAECAEIAQTAMLQSMDDTIQATEALFAEEPDEEQQTLIGARLELGRRYVTIFEAERERLSAIAAGKEPGPPSELPPLKAPQAEPIKERFEQAGYSIKVRGNKDAPESYTMHKDTLRVTLYLDEQRLLQKVRFELDVKEDQHLQNFYQTVPLVVPDWEEAQSWMERQTQNKGTSSTFHGRIFIRLQRHLGGDIVLTLDYL